MKGPTADRSRGAIVRIKLDNFMKYTHMELTPGPSLNVIVGTNGSGKSSLVCAICLGLCGTPQMVGRASHVADYIRHGADTAVIEIELYNPTDRNNIIERQIFSNNKSVWKLNSIVVPQKTVEAKVAELNIQVGNLCQFLPQDRVADFVRMTKQDLLEGTERAVGPRHMLDMHQQLISLQCKHEKLDAALRSQQGRLEQDKQKNSQLDEEMKKFQEHRQAQKKVELLRQKLAWVDYDKTRERYLQEKTSLREEEKKLDAAEQQHRPLRERLHALDKQHSELVQKDKTLKAEAAAAVKKIESALRTYSELTEESATVKNDLQRKIEEEASRSERIKKYENDIAELEKELTGSATQELEEELKQVQQTLTSHNKNLNEICHKRGLAESYISDRRREAISIDHEMKKMKDLSNQRMEILRRRHRDAYEAAVWLQQNENRFRGKIYPPIMTQINVHDPANAKYVEGQIAWKDLMAFVAENSEDLNSFLGTMRDDRNLRINGVVAPTTPLESFHPHLPLEQIKRWGFHSYLSDLFTAPPEIMRYLCSLYQVHNVPVGTHTTEKYVEDVKHSGLRRFYTQDQSYNVKVSRYDRSRVLTMSSEVRNPSLLIVSIDTTNLEELEQRREEIAADISSKTAEIQGISGQEKKLTELLEKCRCEKKRVMTEIARRRQLTVVLEQKKRGLQAIQKDSMDLESEREATKNKLKEVCVSKMSAVNQVIKALQKSFKRHHVCIEHVLDVEKSAADKKKVTAQLKDAEASFRTLEAAVRDTRDKVRGIKLEAQRKLSAAQQAIGCQQTVHEIPHALAQEFRKLPKTADEIERLIHKEQVKLNCMLPVDASLEQEYQQRKKSIEQLEKELSSSEAQLISTKEEMEDIQSRWLPELERLLERINTGFVRFFRALGCAGEVSLYRGERPDKYDQYGVCIRVKFRDHEALTELSAAHQSGGERSVATVLYMMALQELTSVPFRCVDEINQGMDSANERRVFEMIMNTALKNSAQYFLLSPKLLPDLPYAENVTMIFIAKAQNGIPDWDPNKVRGTGVGLASAIKKVRL
ncbi:structural maintenance of chromosomes protein 5-like [Ornithodoros turicata]|uniref:structural maintenance of chromosomes protein 5-like n=1 Tax=Ornithodoros turicata TaxID=34597 RepID=UPI0031388867